MSVRILSIALLLLPVCLYAQGWRHPVQKTIPLCCTKVSSADVSADVIREPPTKQPAHTPCVEALIFLTKKGKVCVNPEAEWTKKFAKPKEQ